ncbi:MAG: bifunctional phosphopantothenoylcysteine decarboxylase/phosphopantothenate--cysteine ligase CoaBC [Deltaproteobacteria bacterium]|nr:bifunctional phosphopantothenoylcysteine decarboxylase/phosphopantothenate--cysteine ligase CoaBC [Deltaproteobacteria bacterium]
MAVLQGKKVVLGITGCIAAYKAVELVRLLVKQGCKVDVVMTSSAQEFIAPLTLQTLSGNPVVTELFELYQEREIGHISLAERAELLVIAPATANTIGKIAGGIADDMLSTVAMATRAPILIAPAMNVNMWNNPVVQRNIETLQERGCFFVDPGQGDLACGAQGVGRLADVGDIVEGIIGALSSDDFAGVKVLVTAGPTREPLDPVRFISNPSSGKMGYALARAFKRRGAAVTLISGPVALPPPPGVAFVPVVTVDEMARAVQNQFEAVDVVVKSAAVGDYRPAAVAPQKIKKTGGQMTVQLEKTEDILAGLGSKKADKILVGFAAETEDILVHGKEKLRAKNLDMIVINDVSRTDIGFNADANEVTVVLSDGSDRRLPYMSKEAVADKLLDIIVELRSSVS